MSELTKFNLIIAGSRTFSDYELLCKSISLNREKYSYIIFCGGAKGADLLGKKYAEEHGLEVKEFPAKWHIYGKKAGMMRNLQMADEAHGLIAFWDGKSRGTAHMIQEAERRNLRIKVVNF